MLFSSQFFLFISFSSQLLLFFSSASPQFLLFTSSLTLSHHHHHLLRDTFTHFFSLIYLPFHSSFTSTPKFTINPFTVCFLFYLLTLTLLLSAFYSSYSRYCTFHFTLARRFLNLIHNLQHASYNLVCNVCSSSSTNKLTIDTLNNTFLLHLQCEYLTFFYGSCSDFELQRATPFHLDAGLLNQLSAAASQP